LANILLFFLISSAFFLIIFDLSHGFIFYQTSKPFSADFKALSTSVDDALDAFPIISSVAGFITLYVSLFVEACHFPSIN